MNPEDYTIKSDNTQVQTKEPKRILFTKEQLQKIQWNKLREAMSKSQSTLSDSNQTAYYNNLQKFTNSNAFGNGLQGKQTYYNPSTKEGQQKIKSDFDYAKSNAQTLGESVALAGVSKGIQSINNGIQSITKGVFRTPSKNGALGTLKQYSKNQIGSGAESVVVNNTPTTVGKMTSIPQSEMSIRNQVPNTVKSTYIGYVKDRGVKLPTYIQDKVKVLTENTFPKYISKLDKSMSKAGFRRVNDPNVQYRAYTNGSIVVDDVSPGNVGLTWFRKPKMIDFNLQTVPDWIAQGFTLKYGGQLYNKLK